jgi:hypothetical protein
MVITGEIRLRSGYNPKYLNIDVDGLEIGHLTLAPDGEVVGSWADELKDRDLVALVCRCYLAAFESVSRT